jgi:hypothetical protein
MQQRKEMINQIRHLPLKVESAVIGLSDSQLNTPYGEGKWTVRQVVHHLADSHLNAFTRFKLTLTENKPTLRPYDQDEWAKTYDTKEAPIQSSILILKGLHERWSDLLDRVPESSWSRPAYHPENGDLVLDDLLRIYSHHGDKHVESITKLRAAKGW